MKYSIAAASLLASMVNGVAVDLAKRDSPLEVKINVIGNSEVRASVTNAGDAPLKVLRVGSLLDESDIEHVAVSSSDSSIPFDGVRLTMATTGLPEEAFRIIDVGETVEIDFDVAKNHDLSAGGEFDLASVGSFSFAEVNGTDIVGMVPFASNHILTHVDGAAAAKVRRDYLEKRTAVQSDCTGAQRTATINAINNCRSLASAAAAQARSTSTAATNKMVEYYKSSSTSTRNTVATVFDRIVSECGSTTSGVSRQFCTDQRNACQAGVIAYTVPALSIMVNCPTFFNRMSAQSRSCHAQDQQGTILHEMTHLSQIAGTDDFGVYGYNAVRRLTAAQNLRHADTYTLFAHSIFTGC